MPKKTKGDKDKTLKESSDIEDLVMAADLAMLKKGIILILVLKIIAFHTVIAQSKQLEITETPINDYFPFVSKISSVIVNVPSCV